MGVGEPSLSITLLENIYFFSLNLLSAVGLGVLVPSRGIFPARGTVSIPPTKLKATLLPGHFRILRVWDQQARRGVSVMAEMIDQDHQGEDQLLVHNGTGSNVALG